MVESHAPRLRGLCPQPRTASGKPALNEQFENLHGVGGGTFARLIAYDPELEMPARVALGAQPSDVNAVLAFDLARRHEALSVKNDAGRALECLAEFGNVRLAFGFEEDGLAVRE